MLFKVYCLVFGKAVGISGSRFYVLESVIKYCNIVVGVLIIVGPVESSVSSWSWMNSHIQSFASYRLL